METEKTDIVIVGTGASGLFAALHLPRDKRVLMITKDEVENSDSFLAQGGICVLHDKDDYDSFMEDTLKAGHYENRRESVDIMIRSSRPVINELIGYGVDFARKADGSLDYTREGCHSRARILFHEDITGKEITSHLLAAVRQLPNVTIRDFTTMVDIVTDGNRCLGIIARDSQGRYRAIQADETILASGGVACMTIRRISRISLAMPSPLPCAMASNWNTSTTSRSIRRRSIPKSRAGASLFLNQSAVKGPSCAAKTVSVLPTKSCPAI